METQNNNEAAKTENEVASKNSEVKADKNVHFEHVKETLELLYKTFPKAFVKDGEVKPLKIGIFDDLKERIASVEGLSITKVRAALRMYTARLKYLYSVKEGVDMKKRLYRRGIHQSLDFDNTVPFESTFSNQSNKK